MNIESKNNDLVNTIIFLFLITSAIFANLDVQRIALSEGLMDLSLKWKLFQYISWLIPLFFAIILIIKIRTDVLKQPSDVIRIVISTTLFILGGFFLFFLYRGAGGYQRFFVDFSVKNFIVWISIACFYYSIRIYKNQKTHPTYTFILMINVLGLCFVLIRLISGISSTPFSLAWSEGNFIYLASTYFSQRIYGVETMIPYIMSTRHLLEGIPFLISTFPIAFHRGWLVFLNLFSVILFALVVVKRFKISKKWWMLIFIWSILYVFLGVVYYNILLSATIILWGFNTKQKGRSFLIVLVASFFGGMNRINWAFTPPLLAILIYLIETRYVYTSFREMIRYLIYPGLLFIFGSTLGIIGLFGYYIAIGGYTFNTFFARMKADSLFLRLLPNDTFPLGVIFASILVTGSMWFFIIKNWKHADQKNTFTLGIILMINLVLFFGSLLVSAKIGGGADLHNMDAYLISVFITMAYVLFPVFNRNEFSLPFQGLIERIMIILLFLIPVLWQVNHISPIRIRTLAQEEQYLNQLQTVIDHYQSFDERPILFVTQRQLLTFDAIKNVDLIPEHELVDVFEMVMAENEEYLNSFRNDLRNKSYSLIVIDPQPKEIVYGRIFNEESNKWYLQVTQTLYEHYDLAYEITLPASSIQVYAAKDIEKQH